MKALWRICLSLGLAATWFSQGVGVCQIAGIHEMQLNITPNRNLSHTYFFFYYYERGLSADTAHWDLYVQKLGNLTANVPFSQTLNLSSIPEWKAARQGLIALNDETNKLVTLGVSANLVTVLTNSPVYFEEEFPGWNETDIGTAVLNDDTSALKEFISQNSYVWTEFSDRDTSGGLVNFTIAEYGGAISVSPILTNKLSLMWDAFPDGLVLSWPAAATNYWALEASTNMTSWDVVTDEIYESGGACWLYDDMSKPTSFYRLRRL
jgi:hypothetical protein